MPRAPILLVVLPLLLWSAPSSGQCLLANPSFEMPGSSGVLFAGWNQFGAVGSSSTATHGAVSARASGPNSGNWDVSGFWQTFTCAPGDRWDASVRTWHTAVHPVTGQCAALLNVEWRDGTGALISYESYAPIDAATPVDSTLAYSVRSGPAPAGTAYAVLLLGVLQSPTDPAPDVYFDQATFVKETTPSLDEIQWSDFPGGRTVTFAGRTWRVKGPGWYGPGESTYCDDASCVWTDAEGRLHLTIRNLAGTWTSSEVAIEDPLGYGDYVFTTVGRVDALDLHAVFGLFIWEYGPCWSTSWLWWNPYNEFDLEFGRWGDPGRNPAQFVAQPYDYPGNLAGFPLTLADGEITSHAFRWLHDRVECRSWRGGPDAESPGTLLFSWTYTGPHIPRPDQPRVHLNLWQFNGPPATEQEVVLQGFRFVPEGSAVGLPDERPGIANQRLRAVRPNPFAAHAEIVVSTERDERASIAIVDANGRLVRTLFDGIVAAGDHTLTWNGRDEDGRAVASGVYFVRYAMRDGVETRRVVRLR